MRQTDGRVRHRFWAKFGGWASAVIIVSLNVNLVIQSGRLAGRAGPYTWLIPFIVIPALLFAAGMLVYITLRPLLFRLPEKKIPVPHVDFTGISEIKAPEYKQIAVALDFSAADKKTLEHALYVGGKSASYILIHAVETAGAWVMGSEIQDLETRSDVQNLEKY
jgi:manganese transport protein